MTNGINIIEIKRRLKNGEKQFPDKVVRALVEEIDAQKESQKWIPVNDRTPKKGEVVFILYENSCRDDLIDAAWFDAGLWWLDSKHCLSRDYENVTHWMPRPELPK